MNAKQITLAIAIGFAASAASAIEATQMEVPESTLTREEVKAELARAQLDGSYVSWNEASAFVDHSVGSGSRSRAEVRAEVYTTARDHAFDARYVGSI